LDIEQEFGYDRSIPKTQEGATPLRWRLRDLLCYLTKSGVKYEQRLRKPRSAHRIHTLSMGPVLF
jgi:hypothetical protein